MLFYTSDTNSFQALKQMMLQLDHERHLKLDAFERVEDLQRQVIGHFRVPKTLTFQNEAKCKTFLGKMSLICKKMQNPFYFNCFERSLILKQRLGATPNGLFFCELTMLLRTPSSNFAMSSYRAFLW